jgi:hypothetical protein
MEKQKCRSVDLFQERQETYVQSLLAKKVSKLTTAINAEVPY